MQSGTAKLLIWGLLVGLATFVGVKLLLEPTAAASLSGTIGAIAGLAIFFLIYLSLERFSNIYEVSGRIAKLAQTAKLQRPARAKREYDDIASDGDGRLESIARIGQRVLGLTDSKIPDIRQKLMAAGYYRDRSVAIYVLMKMFMPLAGLLAGFIASQVYFSGSMINTVVVTLLGAVIGNFLVEYVLNGRIKSRMKKIIEEMPDILDMFVIYTESGMAFDAALGRVVAAMREHCPTTTLELSVLERERMLLPDRMKAFENLSRRCDASIMKSFAAIIRQSEIVGSPISEAMAVLGDEARKERIINAERRAAKIPVLIQIPVVLFILPSIFLVILGPAGIQIMDVLRNVLR